MKNTIKMSLVAALAVAGLSTTASAGGLEDAIKGVSISGKMEVEYDYQKIKAGAIAPATTPNILSGTTAAESTSNTWDLDWDITAKIPVNDMVTAIVGAEGDTGDSITGNGAITSAVNVTKLYFQYANGPVTAMVGKQGIGAPWFDDERGHGVKAIYNAGPVALAAAHFTNTNSAVTAQDVSAAAIIAGNIADSGINASLWYADIADTGDSFTVNVNGKVADMVNFDIRHTDVDMDAANSDASLTKVVLSADFGAVNARIGYGRTGDNTSNSGGAVSFDSGDNDAAVTYGLEQLNIEDLDDADVFHIGAGTTFGATSINVDYINGEAENNTDFDELFLQVDYKMSKNFTIGAHYSMAEVEAAESDVASMSLEYKF